MNRGKSSPTRGRSAARRAAYLKRPHVMAELYRLMREAHPEWSEDMTLACFYWMRGNIEQIAQSMDYEALARWVSDPDNDLFWSDPD